ncbi:MAG TPA: PspC domain-containing protein [Chitinophagaceae bacterium]|nr:PspC domain-containing protein [Chitinophagaceae bacterium]
MKKVININFQGRVIPIEETAYEILQQYIESLRKYFANEEGRDEIINDIEGRIGELFSDRLKKGSTCIADADVHAVMASIGRPEDFEKEGEPTSSGSRQQTSTQTAQPTYTYASAGRGKLYRNADDKIIAGVCSGLANYLGIDPVITRILFVVFVGALFWVYIILWIIVPSQSIQSNVTKRLYRSADDKVIAGVCGGLAAYLNTQVWIPRLIFALPILIGLVSSPFGAWFNDWDMWWGPKVLTGSLGFTLFVTYVILWIAVPVATTSSEKLEMRGERVDLNSIRNTVKEDMESLKAKAQNWGNEVKQTAQNLGEKAKTLGQTAGTHAKAFAAEAAPVARRTGSGIGNVIGILFKAFFLVIAGIVAISLFGLLMGLLFGGFVIFPFKDFVLEGFGQNLLAWLSLLLFLGIPIVALMTWLIRRIMGVRSKNHYLGYVFGSLWTIGLVSFIILVGLFARNFRSGSEKAEELASFTQPSKGKIIVDVSTSNIRYYGGDWFSIDDEDFPVYGVNQDTLMLNTVRVNVVKSSDSLYHVHAVRIARGKNPEVSLRSAEKIQFNITQKDSMLILPKGFPISKEDKFRNQQVLVIIEVPVGKRIQLDGSLDSYEWFNVDFNRNRGWNADWNDHWERSYGWRDNVEYVMTENGLKRTDNLDENGSDRSSIQEEIDVPADSTQPQNKYRYKGNDGKPKTTPDSSKQDKATAQNDPTDEVETSPSFIYMLARIIR